MGGGRGGRNLGIEQSYRKDLVAWRSMNYSTCSCIVVMTI